MTEPATQVIPVQGSGDSQGGHTNRLRLLAFAAVGIVLIAGLLVAMAQGAIAASFTLAGVTGKLSSDRFVARGFSQYGSIEKTDDGAVPVFTTGFRQAEAANFCFSAPVADLPGVGPVILRLATPGARGFRAEDLITTQEQLTGDLLQRNFELGRDAAQLDKGPAEAKGKAGAFGLQSDTVEVNRLRIITRSVTSVTLRLDEVRIAAGVDEKECY